MRFGSRPFGTIKSAVVSVYDTTPKIGVVPCRTRNDDVVIEFGSIGVLKVAEITLTAAMLADPAVPLVLEVAIVFLNEPALLVLEVVGIILTAAVMAPPLGLIVVLNGSFVTPLAGDVLITVGAIQTFKIPGPSSLQPTIKMTRSKAVVSPVESETPRDIRIIREKCVHRLKAVVGFVDEVFMASS